MGLRITSWNVNGIRNPFAYQPWRENKTYQAMFDSLEADIVVMQETKIQRKDLQDDMVLVPGWDVYFSLPKFKKGYSGVAIYTRNSRCCPIRAEEGITGVLCPPNSATRFRDLPADGRIGGYPRPGQLTGDVDEATLDSEGRCVILEFPAFVLIGVYSPATRDETRTDFRLGFQEAMDVRVRNLVAMGKQVVLAGDLNIIRGELDTAGLLDRLRKEDMSLDDFFSMPSRRLLNHLVFGGVVLGKRDEGREAPVLYDLGREFHPVRQGMYTCWETRRNARPSNFGSRIDYVLCSAGIRSWFVDAGIQEGLLGSDHCPVYATLSDMVKVGEKDVHVADVMNPEGMFRAGERLRDWSAKDLLPLSARLIPDFDRRQSIKDMFSTMLKNPVSAIETPISEPEPPISETMLESSEPYPTRPAAQADQSGSQPPGQKRPLAHASSRPQKRPLVTHVEAQRPLVTHASRPQKKAKPGQPDKSSSRAQTSLRGFFTPKPDRPKRLDTAQTSRGVAPEPDPRPDKRLDTARPSPPGGKASSTIPSPHLRIESGPVGQVEPDRPIGEDEPARGRVFDMESESGDRVFDISKDDARGSVFDPIQSKESWSKILTKRVAPKCEHGEPCISLVTKKAGVNCGRSFYMCARPLGPSGEKETGTEWRCGTFIWSSDWR